MALVQSLPRRLKVRGLIFIPKLRYLETSSFQSPTFPPATLYQKSDLNDEDATEPTPYRPFPEPLPVPHPLEVKLPILYQGKYPLVESARNIEAAISVAKQQLDYRLPLFKLIQALEFSTEKYTENCIVCVRNAHMQKPNLILSKATSRKEKLQTPQCKECHAVFYCSEEHRAHHEAEHKLICKEIQIVRRGHINAALCESKDESVTAAKNAERRTSGMEKRVKMLLRCARAFQSYRFSYALVDDYAVEGARVTKEEYRQACEAHKSTLEQELVIEKKRVSSNTLIPWAEVVQKHYWHMRTRNDPVSEKPYLFVDPALPTSELTKNLSEKDKIVIKGDTMYISFEYRLPRAPIFKYTIHQTPDKPPKEGFTSQDIVELVSHTYKLIFTADAISTKTSPERLPLTYVFPDGDTGVFGLMRYKRDRVRAGCLESWTLVGLLRWRNEIAFVPIIRELPASYFGGRSQKDLQFQRGEGRFMRLREAADRAVQRKREKRIIDLKEKVQEGEVEKEEADWRADMDTRRVEYMRNVLEERYGVDGNGKEVIRLARDLRLSKIPGLGQQTGFKPLKQREIVPTADEDGFDFVSEYHEPDPEGEEKEKEGGGEALWEELERERKDREARWAKEEEEESGRHRKGKAFEHWQKVQKGKEEHMRRGMLANALRGGSLKFTNATDGNDIDKYYHPKDVSSQEENDEHRRERFFAHKTKGLEPDPDFSDDGFKSNRDMKQSERKEGFADQNTLPHVSDDTLDFQSQGNKVYLDTITSRSDVGQSDKPKEDTEPIPRPAWANRYERRYEERLAERRSPSLDATLPRRSRQDEFGFQGRSSADWVSSPMSLKTNVRRTSFDEDRSSGKKPETLFAEDPDWLSEKDNRDGGWLEKKREIRRQLAIRREMKGKRPKRDKQLSGTKPAGHDIFL